MEIKNKSEKIFKIKKMDIQCPACKKKSTESYKPFCSKKCSDLDLIKWLSDEYQIINQ